MAAEETETAVDRSSESVTTAVRRTMLRRILLLVVMASLILPFLRNKNHFNRIYDAWHEVLLVGVLAANAGLLTQSVRARQPIPWRDLILWNGICSFLIAVYIHRAMSSVIAWSLMIGIRVAIPSVWLFVIAGLPLLARQLRNRRLRVVRQSADLRPPAPIGSWVRWWFSAALLLCLSEASCLVLWNIRHAPEPLTFPEHLPDPPSDELHIATVGGSTALGWPYHPHYSFVDVTGWQLEQLLQTEISKSDSTSEAIPDGNPRYRRIVVHNLARAGDALKQDIQNLHQLQVRPQVLLLYTGHNELYHEIDHVTRINDSPVPVIDRLLSWSPTFSVADESLAANFSSLWRLRQMGRSLVDESFLSEQHKRQRLETFRYRLNLLAEFCRRNAIRCVWFIPAASEADCPPNRSVVDSAVTPDRVEQLIRLYRKGQEQQKQRDWMRAAETWRRGLQDHPQFAEFHFCLGHCLLQLQQFDEARKAFQAALEHDAYPVRAQADYRRTIRLVAEQFEIATIDAAELLRNQTQHGILDREIILDDVHPVLKGIFVLGTAAATELSDLFSTRQQEVAEAEFASFNASLERFSLNPTTLAAAYQTLAGVLHNRARYRFDETHWKNLEHRLRAAADRLPKTAELPDDTGIESLAESAWNTTDPE